MFSLKKNKIFSVSRYFKLRMGDRGFSFFWSKHKNPSANLDKSVQNEQFQIKKVCYGEGLALLKPVAPFLTR